VKQHLPMYTFPLVLWRAKTDDRLSYRIERFLGSALHMRRSDEVELLIESLENSDDKIS
jgi:hypothetical protein